MKIKLVWFPFLLLMFLYLGGCATAAKPQAMVVQSPGIISTNENLIGKMHISGVTGGKKTNPMWTSKVDSLAFRQALEKSLKIAGYLSASENEAPYKVSANLKKLDQPLFGATFNVTSTVDYLISSPNGDRAIPITATGTAKVSDAWAGVSRLKIANERSIQENIKAFLQKLNSF